LLTTPVSEKHPGSVPLLWVLVLLEALVFVVQCKSTCILLVTKL